MVVSANPINQVRRTVVVIPLSTSAKTHPPITVAVNCGEKKVVAVCDQIRAIDKSRLLNCFDKLSVADLKKIDTNLTKVLSL